MGVDHFDFLGASALGWVILKNYILEAYLQKNSKKACYTEKKGNIILTYVMRIKFLLQAERG